MQASDFQNLRTRLLNAVIFISDVISILFALVYILFACVVIILGLGDITLKLWLIGATGAYVIVSLIFLIFLGRGRKLKKAFSLFIRYLKYTMRIINMFLVFAILVDMSFGNRIIAVLGIIVLIVSFLVHLFLDIVTLLLKIAIRKVAKSYKGTFEAVKADFVKSFDGIRGKGVGMGEKPALAMPIDRGHEVTSEEW